MKRVIVFFIMIAAAVSCETCRDMKSLNVNEFARYLKRRNVVLIDVRTPEEHAQGHIPGTDFNFDVLEESFESMVLENISPDSNVAIYCRSGNRSKTAGAFLVSNCYRVVELGSGFNGWKESGRDLEH